MSLRGRQVATSSTAARRFVIVTVGGVRFAMQAEYVKGLLRPEEVGSVAALTIHGQTYGATDLAAALQLSLDAEGADSRIILFAKGEGRTSLLVAQVHGLKDIDESQLLPLPRHFQGEERRWYQGMILSEDGVALVLNPDWLIAGCITRPARQQVAVAGKPL